MSDKFISPCAQPTPYEREAATILIEECVEVIQRATKLLRFGVEEVQEGQPYSNAIRLGLEVGDLLEAIELAMRADIITPGSVARGRANKKLQLAKYLQNEAPNA